MKVVATVILVCLSLAAIVSLRGGNDFNILRILPFLGGYRPSMYDVASLTLIVITIGGITRLLVPAADDDKSEEDYEIVEDTASSGSDDSKDDGADEEDDDDDDK